MTLHGAPLLPEEGLALLKLTCFKFVCGFLLTKYIKAFDTTRLTDKPRLNAKEPFDVLTQKRILG